MGEVTSGTVCHQSGHSFTIHYHPKGGTDWLAFRSRFGADHTHIGLYIFDWIYFSHKNPDSPFFGDVHEWRNFSINYTENGFGNDKPGIDWVSDPSYGDNQGM